MTDDRYEKACKNLETIKNIAPGTPSEATSGIEGDRYVLREADRKYLAAFDPVTMRRLDPSAEPEVVRAAFAAMQPHATATRKKRDDEDEDEEKSTRK